jgi:lysophospholipase L1-like esterase
MLHSRHPVRHSNDMTKSFRQYVALGDSMSIDLYPALDAGETDVAVALERVPSAGHVAPIGAASLFYRNDETLWPDDIGDDLVSQFPGIEHQNVAMDGATVGDVFGEQIPQLEASEEPTLLTLTIGGNDLLSAYGSHPRGPLLERIARDIAEGYDLLVDSVRRLFTDSLLILSTVYDPSDGTGQIPGVYDNLGPLPLHVLDAFNGHIRQLAAGTPNVRLADVHAHFLGHGVTAREEDRWYWRRSLIEPGKRGASEIRHIWLREVEAVTTQGRT